jgi:ribonuclease Y
MKEEADKDIKNMKNEVLQKELRLTKKEETLDSKIEKLEDKSLEITSVGLISYFK